MMLEGSLKQLQYATGHSLKPWKFVLMESDLPLSIDIGVSCVFMYDTVNENLDYVLFLLCEPVLCS